ncbi:MAG: hypothetical protein ACI9KE_004514 [Polyangiales bacterium]|jgi:hypothetical protein
MSDSPEPEAPTSVWPERLVRILDDGLKIPFTKGIGLDAIVGFFLPVAGDALTGMGSLALLGLAIRRGVPTLILARMVLNIGVDVILGALPVLGDLFDLIWRSNRRNLELLEEHAGKKSSATAGDYLVVGLGFVLAIAAIVVPILVLAYIGGSLLEYLRAF